MELSGCAPPIALASFACTRSQDLKRPHFCRFAGAKIVFSSIWPNFLIVFRPTNSIFYGFSLLLHTKMTNSICKTKGIVLSTVPYNDRARFVHIYTEQLGKVSCKIMLSRLHHNGGQRPFYAPLSMLELVLEGRAGQDLWQIKEASLLCSPYTVSMLDPGKTAQCLYMAELLDRTIREVEANPRLWRFVSQSIELLQLTQQGSANFHLLFTTRLCYLIGFHVDNSAWREGMLFDISEGIYTAGPIYHQYYLTADSACWLHQLLDTRFSDLGSLHLNRQQRNVLLDMMLTFLRIHLPEVGTLRSVEVLKELFD